MTYKVFANGNPLQASEINLNLMQQAIAVFTDATARDAAISVPVNGQFAYLTASDELVKYDGAAWVVAVENSPVTTEGDLIVGGSGGTAERLAIGAADTVATSNGTTVTWESVAAGGMTLLASGSLTSSILNLTSISADYNHLQLVINNLQTSTSTFGFRFNGDSNQRYTYAAFVQWNTDVQKSDPLSAPNNLEVNVGRDFTGNTNNSIKINLIDYSSTAINSIEWCGNRDGDNFGAVGCYKNAVAINRIASVLAFTGNYELWGIK